jgi:hypothetical protein
VNLLQRRRSRLLIRRAQPFAEEQLVAVANFTWVGNSLGAQPGRRGHGDWAGGLPNWTLIGAGATRLYIIEAARVRTDTGVSLIGSWPLDQMLLTKEVYPRRIGPIPFFAWRAIRFEFPDRQPAVLQPFGREVDDLLTAHRAAQQAGSQDGVRWDGLAEVTLMTTSRGPFEEDVFFVLAYADGSNTTIPLGEAEHLLPRLQQLPGFDNESFIQAMGISHESICSLWRA